MILQYDAYTCAVIRLSDRLALPLHLWIIRSHWDGSPIMRPWYLQRRISAGIKFPPSPHLKLSHRGGCGELAQDPRMQTAVWKRLPIHSDQKYLNRSFRTGPAAVLILRSSFTVTSMFVSQTHTDTLFSHENKKLKVYFLVSSFKGFWRCEL